MSLERRLVSIELPPLVWLMLDGNRGTLARLICVGLDAERTRIEADDRGREAEAERLFELGRPINHVSAN